MPQSAASGANRPSCTICGALPWARCMSCAWEASNRLARSRMRVCRAPSNVWYGPSSVLGSQDRTHRA
eukprot:8451701-Lingulodinium_polyedra.AAC.1